MVRPYFTVELGLFSADYSNVLGSHVPQSGPALNLLALVYLLDAFTLIISLNSV